MIFFQINLPLYSTVGTPLTHMYTYMNNEYVQDSIFAVRVARGLIKGANVEEAIQEEG